MEDIKLNFGQKIVTTHVFQQTLKENQQLNPHLIDEMFNIIQSEIKSPSVTSEKRDNTSTKEDQTKDLPINIFGNRVDTIPSTQEQIPESSNVNIPIRVFNEPISHISSQPPSSFEDISKDTFLQKAYSEKQNMLQNTLSAEQKFSLLQRIRGRKKNKHITDSTEDNSYTKEILYIGEKFNDLYQKRKTENPLWVNPATEQEILNEVYGPYNRLLKIVAPGIIPSQIHQYDNAEKLIALAFLPKNQRKLPLDKRFQTVIPNAPDLNSYANEKQYVTKQNVSQRVFQKGVMSHEEQITQKRNLRYQEMVLKNRQALDSKEREYEPENSLPQFDEKIENEQNLKNSVSTQTPQTQRRPGLARRALPYAIASLAGGGGALTGLTALNSFINS